MRVWFVCVLVLYACLVCMRVSFVCVYVYVCMYYVLELTSQHDRTCRRVVVVTLRPS